jgi:anti-sigma regulatory factor (Ser/Thr protein kinase)
MRELADVRKAALTKDPGSAGRARRVVEETLEAWDRTDVADVVTLLTSELVTNALLHGGGPIELAIDCRDETIRVAVSDTGRAQPAPRQPAADEPGGRGLALVESLAASWGVQPTQPGKAVWFEVRA